MVSSDGKCLYFMGIIDTLTGYGGAKKLENTFKSIVYDSKTISCIPPVAYGDRFYNFMVEHVYKEWFDYLTTFKINIGASI